MTALDLNDVVALGHSLGCTILWSYWDLFGSERLSKLILVDQPSLLIDLPTLSQSDREAAGALRSADDWVAHSLNIAASESQLRARIERFTTSGLDPAIRKWMIDENEKTPPFAASALLFNHGFQDWRDVIPRINVPVVVVGGRASFVPWRSQQWIHEQIPGSRLELFDADEGGGHFPFIENPERFNRLVAEFIG